MKTCPCCGTRLNDAQSRCPACGADYLETVIDALGGSDPDVAMRLSALEEGLRPLEDAPSPTLTETARRMTPLLGGGTALFCLVAGFVSGANIFYLLAVAAAVPSLLGLFARLHGRQASSSGEAIARAAARVFDDEAARLRERCGEQPEVAERLAAMQHRIEETLARQQEARIRNTRTIRNIAAGIFVIFCIAVGALAVRNHAARKAAAAYEAQAEWVKLRDAYLASSDNDEFGDNAARLVVLRAMLDAGERAAAEEFFFSCCQGYVGDIDCALLIVGCYKDDPGALAAFIDRVSLRYDSDTRKIKCLKP